MIGRMLYILGSDGDCEGFVRWIIVWKQKLVIYAAYREDEKYKGFFLVRSRCYLNRDEERYLRGNVILRSIITRIVI
jgi:hypothetical protein